MNNRSLLLSAIIACCVHVAVLFLNFGATPPSLASMASSIEVDLVAPPQSAPAAVPESPPAEEPPVPEPEPPEEPAKEIEFEPEVIPEPEPISVQEPTPVIEPEPEPIPVPEMEHSEPTRKGEAHVVKEAVAPAVIQREEPTNRIHNETTGDDTESSAENEDSVPTLDSAPAYTYNPKPSYSRAARRRGQQGTVILLVEVLPNGRVGGIDIDRSSGHQLLDDAAVKAVKKWRFTPAKKGRTSVRAWVKIPVEFNLEDR